MLKHKNYRAQTPQNLALSKILQNLGKRAHPWSQRPLSTCHITDLLLLRSTGLYERQWP